MMSSSDEQEEEEKQETSEQEIEGASKQLTVSDDEQENEGASKGIPASDDEQENEGASKWFADQMQPEKSVASCDTSDKTHGTKMDMMTEHAQSLSWIPHAVANIRSMNIRMLLLRLDGFPSFKPCLASFKTCLLDLESIRGAAMAFVTSTDPAISFAKAQINLLDRKSLEQKISALQHELARSAQQSQAVHCMQCALLQEAKEELLKQNTLFQKEKESLTCSHKVEIDALIDQYTHEQRGLKRQLEDERDKSICCVCHDKPRDTIILPCLHFQYCFSCLLRHRDATSNTCPTCGGPIQGLSMSSYLATQ